MKTGIMMQVLTGVALIGSVALGQGDRPMRPGARGEPWFGQRQGPGGPQAGGPGFGQRQGPGGTQAGGPNPERLKAAGATEQQIAALGKLQEEQQLKRIDAQAAVDKAEVALRQLMDSGQAEEQAAHQAIDALSRARAELMKQEVSARLKGKTILGEEVLGKLREERPERGGERPGARRAPPPAKDRPPQDG